MIAVAAKLDLGSADEADALGLCKRPRSWHRDTASRGFINHREEASGHGRRLLRAMMLSMDCYRYSGPWKIERWRIGQKVWEDAGTEED